MLYSHLRVNQIFGANTNVGKTIFSTILCLATAQTGRRVFYLKPVSTGSSLDADDLHIKKYRFSNTKIKARCLYQMDDPVSPHLAAQASHLTIPDRDLLRKVYQHLAGCAKKAPMSNALDAAYVETAGGVLSPVPSGIPQADAYRPLRLPAILIGDSNLGGISSTLSAFESLHSRGYTTSSILLFDNKRYQNHTYLTSYFAEHHPSVKVFTFRSPPERISGWTHVSGEVAMRGYYRSQSTTTTAATLVQHLDEEHLQRIRDLQNMGRRATEVFWYPFVQHNHVWSNGITTIDSAHGDNFNTFSLPPATKEPIETYPPAVQHARQAAPLLRPKFDGSASWWTQGLGHGNDKVNKAAVHAAGRYGHVIFPLSVHEPALELAQTLLEKQGKGWASRVFFSDNGSTGIEVAIKMALRATAMLYRDGDGKAPELGVLGLKGSYHGDTIGAMDASEGGVYNSTVEWYKGRGYWLDVPTLAFEGGQLHVRVPWLQDKAYSFGNLNAIYDVANRRASELEVVYKTYIQSEISKALDEGHRFGALMLEPLILGAGGMQFVDPLYQTVLVETVRALSNTLLPPPSSKTRTTTLPVIFDEVFSGLGRLGFSNPASSILGVNPDIAVYAKLLTGGLMPMAVTLATRDIFEVFRGDEKAQALLHGHSYTAYPTGCAVANASLKLLDEALKSEDWIRARTSWSSDGQESYQPTTFIDKEKGDTPCSLWSYNFVQSLSKMKGVKRVMSLGTVVAFELEDSLSGYNSLTADAALAPLRIPPLDPPESSTRLGADIRYDPDDPSVHFRTLGNVGYLICSLNSEKRLIRRMEEKLLQIFQAA